MEKQEKPIDKDKNEKLKALLSLYAKPMVNAALNLLKCLNSSGVQCQSVLVNLSCRNRDRF